MALSARAIDTAKPREAAYKLADRDGLYLFVSPAGGKSWRANYREAGKQKTRTYGRWPGMTLAQAREAHAAARGGVAEPETAASPTFEETARKWLLVHLPGLSNPKHRHQVEETLSTYVYPAIGSRPLGEIKRAELVAAIQAAGLAGKVETAHRVAGRISAVFAYAQDAGIIESHPAANLARVLVPRKVQKPMASIPPDEAGALMRAIDTYPDTVTRLALELLSLTFVRVGELRGMQWDELREDGAVWLVPAQRMKAKLPHVVPLAPRARAILAQLREMTDGTLVLDSPTNPGHPLSENTLLFALYRLGYRGRMTAHGFRALASTVLNERSGFPADVIERQLAHRETDAVRAAYHRAEYLPQRRELMVWWANWLQSAREALPPSNESPRRS